MRSLWWNKQNSLEFNIAFSSEVTPCQWLLITKILLSNKKVPLKKQTTYKFIGLLNDKPPQCGKIWNYSAYPVALLPLKSM
jgi:hypothetical protein